MKEEELKGILNHCLNNAMVGKGRIKGTVSSNDIAEFINEWLPKQSSIYAVVQAKPEKVYQWFLFSDKLPEIETSIDMMHIDGGIRENIKMTKEDLTTLNKKTPRRWRYTQNH